MEGNIFDIQRFCVHDGPGIRTTVFFKGCPLRCEWCHNPESQRSAVSIAYYSHKCIGCKSCENACEVGGHRFDGLRVRSNGDECPHYIDRAVCVACGKCVGACPAGALERLGRRVSADEILAEVGRDKIFYKNSGGGVTFSGGEPLMQADFLTELLTRSREMGIHTCIETCGFANSETVRAIAPLVDLFLFDIKETDDERHKALTGVPFTPIKENLLLLSSMGAKIILRCPIVPDRNMRDEHLEAIGRLAATVEGVIDTEVMAYHTLGAAKYDALDMENGMAGAVAMTEEQKKYCIEKINEAKKLG